MSDRQDVVDRVRKFWSDTPRLFDSLVNQPGCDLPDISAHEWSPLGDVKFNNWLVAPLGYKANLECDVRGEGNVVILGNGCTLEFQMILANQNATIIIGENTGENGGRLNVYGNGEGGIIFVGKRTSCNAAALFLLGDYAKIIIGEDCMFAHSIVLRTNDDHAMIDMKTGKQFNSTANIIIEPHVWICPDVTILRKTTVGFGSIVGVKSVVRGNFPSYSLLAGAPARVSRTGVSWDRSQIASPDYHLKIKEFGWQEQTSDKLP